MRLSRLIPLVALVLLAAGPARAASPTLSIADVSGGGCSFAGARVGIGALVVWLATLLAIARRGRR